MELSLRNVSVGLVGLAGVSFVGYCIYFDSKRRRDPLYKENIRKRRKEEKKGEDLTAMSPEQLQRYFMMEIKKGEECLEAGAVEEGVKHMVNATNACGQPQQLLQVLQQTVPPQVFQLIVMEIAARAGRTPAAAPPPRRVVTITEEDDDLE